MGTPSPTAYPTLLSIQIRLAIDVPLAAVLTAATFAGDFDGGLWDPREGVSSLDAFLLGAASFAILFGGTHVYVWRRLRRATVDPGVVELPPQSVVFSRRQTVIHILKWMPLSLFGVAIPILMAGPLGAGMVVGGTLGSAASLLVWRIWERRSGLLAFTPVRPVTQRLSWKKEGPWLYYGSNLDPSS